MIDARIGIDRDSYVEREELKSFYNTPTGIKILKDRILMCGLLSEITDPEGVTAHNICVKELERIGILDEEGLEPLLKYLLTRDATKRPAEEKGA